MGGTCLLVGHGHEHGHNVRLCDSLFVILEYCIYIELLYGHKAMYIL